MADRKRNVDVVDLLSSDDDDDSDCEIISPPRNAKAKPAESTNVKKTVKNPYASTKKTIKNPYASAKETVKNPYASDKETVKNPYASASKKTKKTTTSSGEQASKRSPLEDRVSTEQNQKMAAVPSAKSVLGRSSNYSTTGRLFNVATYNVWFETPPYPEERMKTIVQVLLEKNQSDCPLWFVGFQEVTPFLWSILRPLLEASGYSVFNQDFMGQYGVALAVLQKNSSCPKIIEKGWRPYQNTIQGRGFLYVRARLPQSHQQVLFTTTHLESFVPDFQGQRYTGSKERQQQVSEMESFCLMKSQQFSQDLSLSIITGDLNWDDERPQSKGEDSYLLAVLSSKDWQDSWLVVKERELERLRASSKNGKVAKKNIPACYTYDCKVNPMFGGGLRRRFDRIIFEPKNGIPLEVKGVDLIGKEAIPGLVYDKVNKFNGAVRPNVPVAPSDHFGYVATFQVNDL